MKFKGVFEHPVVMPLVLAFILLNLIVTEYGGTNARSRNAALRAMSESHTFAITRYKDWTIDWAQTPDGAYYSNKAPGPMLLGFPLYWTLDQIAKPFEKNWRDSLGRRTEPPYWFHVIFMFFLQIFPFVFLCGWAASLLANAGASVWAIIFSLLAMLFANTAVVFMNSNFGHGFAAVLVLAVALFVCERNFFMAGLMTGFAVLSDYGMIMQLPGLLLGILIVLWRKPISFISSASIKFFIGVLPGAFLWSWYHESCFGSIFALPNKFQNPDFVDMKDKALNLWGVITLPSTNIVYELILGPTRGILFTQPYLLLLPLLAISLWWRERKMPAFQKRNVKFLWNFGVFSLLGLVFMNAGFGGWHGGYTPGPRYLSAIFPLLAVLCGSIYDRLHLVEKSLLWGCLAIALVFRSLVYAHGVLVPIEPMWNYLLSDLSQHHLKTAILRVSIFFFVIALAVFWAQKRARIFYSLVSRKAQSVKPV